ncbi:MAG: hypothetical protein GEU94_10085 [Micromonosporaceae bacterium]|nr:hypothetical protein [Micromonosporaceae bacterium]
MARYDLGKSSDLRRWARDTVRGMEKELNREFRQRPVRIPVEIEQRPSSGPLGGYARPLGGYARPLGAASSAAHTAGDVTINVSGDGNQLAVGNSGEVRQSIVRGLPASDLAELIKQLRLVLPELGLNAEDQDDYEAALTTVEKEVERDEPNKGRVRRALAAMGDFLKGTKASETAKALAPLVSAAVQGLQSASG